MTPQQFIQTLKKGDFQPLYLLEGPEAYPIDTISKYFEENALSEAERAFNQMIYYGKDTEPKTLIDAACRYPMMAARQLIVLKEAQDMKELPALLPYIEKPVPTTILVVCYKHKKFDTRTKFGKAMKAKAVCYESKKLYDNQVPDWVQNYLKGKKLDIKMEAAELISEYLGSDQSKIANELDKLALNVEPGTVVGEREVMANIGISKEYNVFELQKALGQRNVLKANRIVNYFISNPKKSPLIMVIGAMYNFFSKVYMVHFLRNTPDREIAQALKLRSDYFLKDYKLAARNYPLAKTKQVIHLLSTYDLRSKGVDNINANEGELLKEMIFQILH